MLRCPCRKGEPPYYQDSFHLVMECGETEQLRHDVVTEMGEAMHEGGSLEERRKWRAMSQERKLSFSLSSRPAFSKGIEGELKAIAAKLWTEGIREAMRDLERETEGFSGAVDREAEAQALGRALARDNEQTEEDLRELLEQVL